MPRGKESSPRIAIGRKLLTEEPSCEAGDFETSRSLNYCSTHDPRNAKNSP